MGGEGIPEVLAPWQERSRGAEPSREAHSDLVSGRPWPSEALSARGRAAAPPPCSKETFSHLSWTSTRALLSRGG